MTRVLLISPWRLDGLVCGDDIITDLLMAHPPQGVEFTHFGEGLEAGWLSRSAPFRAWLSSLVMHSRPPAGVPYRWEGLPPLPFRLMGKLLPDRPDLDVQWLKLEDASRFDLVHAYTFPLHLSGKARTLPVVLGNSSANSDLLRHYYHVSEAVSGPLVARDRALLRRLGVHHDLYHAEQARLVTVPSHYARRLHLDAGVPDAKLRVVRIGMPAPVLTPNRDPAVCRFTLVGQQFWRKGGRTLVAAFDRLRRVHPEARLTIVSSVPESELGVDMAGITLIPSLPRADILGRIYPETDVYLLPTLAEGYGLSVVEAIGHGLPVIATAIGALPELVEDGVSGRLVPPDDVDALYEAMKALMEDPALRLRMGQAGRSRFLAEHEVGVTNAALAAVYDEALG